VREGGLKDGGLEIWWRDLEIWHWGPDVPNRLLEDGEVWKSLGRNWEVVWSL